MVIDTTLDTAKELEELSSRLLAEVNHNLSTSEEIFSFSKENYLSHIENKGVVSDRRKANHYLDLEISSRVNDIELGVSAQGINKYLRDFSIKPISFIKEGIEVKITPNSLSVIDFVRFEANEGAYSTESRQKLVISISGQNSIEVEAKIRTVMLFDDSNYIHLRLLNHPRFVRNGQDYDPFLRLPVSLQQDARDELLINLDKELKANSIELDAFLLGRSRLSVKPVTSYIRGDLLGVTSKVVGKRRYKRELVGYIPRIYDQRISISREIIRNQINRIVKSKGGKLRKIDFFNGYLDIKTYSRFRKDILYIAVISEVEISYRIRIYSQFNAINYSADWLKWEYKITAKRCVPVCREVIKEAKKITEREINKSLRFSGGLGSINHIATRSNARIAGNGLNIDIEMRK